MASASPAIIYSNSKENAIVRENKHSGDSSWYSPITRQALGPNGFASNMSILPSQRISFKVDYLGEYNILIYRLGYYGGVGGRLYANITVATGAKQPPCNFDVASKMTDCDNWKISAYWDVPTDATTGIYVGVPMCSSGSRGTYIPFVVRQPAGGTTSADLLFKTADTTWVAYNMYGGWNLYRGNGSFSLASRAQRASYNRPFFNRLPVPKGKNQNFLFGSEYAFLYWVEKHGYDIAYTSSADIESFSSDAAVMKRYKVLLSVGHDEYWTQKMKSVYETARDYGVNLGFFSGNEIFWRILWEEGTDSRVLVCRKESMDRVKAPSPEQWTGTFQDPRFRTADPQNALTGQLWMVNGMRKDALKVNRQDAKLRFWRNSSISSRMVRSSAGRHHNGNHHYQYISPSGVLGYEWDEFTNDCHRPFGAFTMSSSTYNIVNLLNQEYGTSFY